jgi:hypothetical protein
MTSRRQRKINRENSLAGIFRRLQEDRPSIDAARWRPGKGWTRPYYPAAWERADRYGEEERDR